MWVASHACYDKTRQSGCHIGCTACGHIFRHPYPLWHLHPFHSLLGLLFGSHSIISHRFWASPSPTIHSRVVCEFAYASQLRRIHAFGDFTPHYLFVDALKRVRFALGSCVFVSICQSSRCFPIILYPMIKKRTSLSVEKLILLAIFPLRLLKAWEFFLEAWKCANCAVGCTYWISIFKETVSQTHPTSRLSFFNSNKKLSRRSGKACFQEGERSNCRDVNTTACAN